MNQSITSRNTYCNSRLQYIKILAFIFIERQACWLSVTVFLATVLIDLIQTKIII